MGKGGRSRAYSRCETPGPEAVKVEDLTSMFGDSDSDDESEAKIDGLARKMYKQYRCLKHNEGDIVRTCWTKDGAHVRLDKPLIRLWATLVLQSSADGSFLYSITAVPETPAFAGLRDRINRQSVQSASQNTTPTSSPSTRAPFRSLAEQYGPNIERNITMTAWARASGASAPLVSALRSAGVTSPAMFYRTPFDLWRKPEEEGGFQLTRNLYNELMIVGDIWAGGRMLAVEPYRRRYKGRRGGRGYSPTPSPTPGPDSTTRRDRRTRVKRERSESF